MSFKFLDDVAIADVAFEVTAPDLNSLFSDAADAFLAVLIHNPESVREVETVALELENKDLDILLYLFLQELVFLKDVKGLLLKVKSIQVDKTDAGYSLKTVLSGEALDASRHEQRADIKAVTFHSLEAKTTGRKCRATVVLDI